jgi:hypothetical protein
MTTYPDELRVLYDGHEVGTAIVTERHPMKFFGRFVPGGEFESQRAAFDEVVRWNRQAEGKLAIDYAAWDRWIALVGEMTQRIKLPEVEATIEEFAISEDLGLEVTFVHPVA